MLSSEFAGCTGKLQVLHLKKWMCTQDGNPLPPTAAGTWDNKKPAYFCQIFLENEGLSGKSETEHFNSIRCLIRDSWEQQQDKLLEDRKRSPEEEYYLGTLDFTPVTGINQTGTEPKYVYEKYYYIMIIWKYKILYFSL